MFSNQKKVDMSKISALIHKFPVVPLYGDMQQTLDTFLVKSPHFDRAVWGEASKLDKQTAAQYEIINRLDQTRQQYNDYLSRFSALLIEIGLYKDKPESVSPETSRSVANLVLQGLQLLADWTSQVLSQSAYKFASPNNDPALKVDTDYERVVRKNYSEDEKFALIEYLGMIKGLASNFLNDESILLLHIRRYIHWDLQMFLQGECKNLILYTVKKKKKQKEDFQKMRTIAADWIDGVEPADSYVEKKKR